MLPSLLAFIFSLLVLESSAQTPQPSPAYQILPQCQCIPNPSGSGCLQYDSRYQAATLEEAMTSFPDLSLEKNDTAPDETLEAMAVCSTKECRDCQDDMRRRMKEIGLLPSAINEALIAQGNSTSSCKKYHFSRGDQGVYTKAKRARKDDDSSSDSDSDEDDDEEEEKEKKARKRATKEHKKERERRSKRQTVTTDSASAIVGERFSLSCTAKGVTTDSTGLVSLCSSCWVWRRLPDNYVPQYINELVCDDQDDACLSGYANCGVGHRAIEVVRNDNGVQTTVALSAGAYCECRIKSGSALQSLVSGTGLPTALPAAPQTTQTGK